jgi:hypothetical protein
MSVHTRNLLDRFRTLVLRNVLIIDNSSSLSIENVLRLINIRELTEAAEVARVIHSEIKSHSMNGPVVINETEQQLNEISGISYWTRRLMLQAAQESHQSNKTPYDELQEVTKLMTCKGKSSKNEQLIRKFPQIVRNFYECVDWSLPIY